MPVRLLVALLIIIAAFQFGDARASEGLLPIKGYKHTSFTLDQGAPGLVYTFAQTHDGYLWIGSYYGLWRYDGVQFEQVKLPFTLPRRSEQIQTLFADRAGNLWIGHNTGGFTRYRNGEFQDLNLVPPRGVAISLVEDEIGRVWALSGSRAGARLGFYYRGRWQDQTDRLGLKGLDPLAMIRAGDGTFWIVLRSGVAYLRPTATRFQVLIGTVSDQPALVEASDRSVWLLDRAGVRELWDGLALHAPRIAAPSVRFPNAANAYFASARDKSGALWIGASGSGLFRMMPGRSGIAMPGTERLSTSGLSSPLINAVFSDRENNIWVGTNQGIDKFRAVPITKVLSLEGSAQSFGFWTGGVQHSTNGRVVLRAGTGSFYRVKDGGAVETIRGSSSPTVAVCIDAQNMIWLWKRHALVRSDGRGRIELPHSSGAPYYPSCVMAKDQTWVTSSNGLFRLDKNRRWERRSLDPQFRPIGPQVLALDDQGGVLASYPNSRVVQIDGNRQAVVLRQDGPLGTVNVIEPEDGGLLLGGEYGLGRFSAKQMHVLSRERYPLLDDVSGIALQTGGNLWLAVRHGLLEISAQSLDAAFKRPGLTLRYRLYGPKDGLSAFSLAGWQNNLAFDKVGRLWIATVDGVFMFDPARQTTNTQVPSVVIKSLIADGQAQSLDGTLVLAKGTSDIQIDFTAPSLGDPQRVRVQYRLWGHDRTWTQAGTRRQAIYTSLPPGTYRFQAVAANEDGVWNRTGQSLEIRIPPTFLQSQTFTVLCCALAALAFVALCRMRLNQISMRIKARLEERLGERERIARELHDTLLQSVQGLIVGMQNVADDLPGGTPAREQMTRTLDRADDLLAESRDRVHDLRQSTLAGGLSGALLILARRTFDASAVDIRSTIDGEERDLHPVVADELVRIAEEALFNVLKHAKANQVSLTVIYAKRRLTVRLEDNGVGVPRDQAQAPGRQFGLIGMRERASRIGGVFELTRRTGGGTVVQIVLPARAAYAREDQDQATPWGFLARRVQLARRFIMHLLSGAPPP